MELSAPTQFQTFQGGCSSPVESLWCSLTSRIWRSLPGNSRLLLGLFREAHHLLRWQPADTLHSSPKVGDGGEIAETRGTRHVSFIQVACLVQFPELRALYLMVVVTVMYYFLGLRLGGIGLKKINIISNFQGEVKNHMRYLCGSLPPFLLGTFWRCENWGETVRSGRTAEKVQMW